MASTSPIRLAILLCAGASVVPAHDVISTKLTWSQEVSRIIFKRCANCHRPGGKTPMALLTYEEARPWAKAIKEEVLERRMPPWGAMKGFGDFHGDPSLTPEEIHTLADWVEGGAPEGDPKYLPDPPPASERQTPMPTPVAAGDGFRLGRSTKLEAIRPTGLTKGQTMQVTAELPGGSRVPLLWIYGFDPRWTHTYVYRDPPRLPAGTRLRIAGPGSVRLRTR